MGGYNGSLLVLEIQAPNHVFTIICVEFFNLGVYHPLPESGLHGHNFNTWRAGIDFNSMLSVPEIRTALHALGLSMLPSFHAWHDPLKRGNN